MSADADSVHHIAELAAWSFAGTALAVLGRPVAHSLSPAIHHAALAAMARTDPRFASWRYFKFEVDPADLPEALDRLHRAGFHGLNLTVPHKTVAVACLAASDDFVRAAGAANTLIRRPGGWRGANTDGVGLSAALRQEFSLELAGAEVVLLGAGGAARAAAVECLQRGCRSLWIGNRSAENLAALLAVLRPRAGRAVLREFDLLRPPPVLPAGALVLNATSLGLKPGDPSPIDLAKIPRPAMVFDMIYRPPQTALLRQAAALGVRHANGLSMLVHQGARALELWSGAAVPVAEMQRAALAAD
ncbi:MAG TPA: shikimate dehydrogenase [Lacunisphaera sp.]|nr:shikimate dehydrogenase [Lacunisphaera sp.]